MALGLDAHHQDALREILMARKAIRAFTPEPVRDQVLREVLFDASRAPSNCNTQPWELHIVSGPALRRLSVALLTEFRTGRQRPDFPFDAAAYSGLMGERRDDHDAHVYAAQGVSPHDDAESHRRAMERGLEFYGAPQAAFLFMPVVGNNDVRVAADLGIFAQTLLLSLTARGLGSIGQTMLSLYPDVVRTELGLPSEKRLLLGISFGHVDEADPANATHLPRDTSYFYSLHNR